MYTIHDNKEYQSISNYEHVLLQVDNGRVLVLSKGSMTPGKLYQIKVIVTQSSGPDGMASITLKCNWPPRDGYCKCDKYKGLCYIMYNNGKPFDIQGV